jgi:hypothetical protein
MDDFVEEKKPTIYGKISIILSIIAIIGLSLGLVMVMFYSMSLEVSARRHLLNNIFIMSIGFGLIAFISVIFGVIAKEEKDELGLNSLVIGVISLVVFGILFFSLFLYG